MFRSLNVRVLGGVENMTASPCPHCGAGLSPFLPAPSERSIWAMGLEKLAEIPLRFDGAPGVPGPAAHAAIFDRLAERVIAALEAS